MDTIQEVLVVPVPVAVAVAAVVTASLVPLILPYLSMQWIPTISTVPTQEEEEGAAHPHPPA